MKIGNAVIFLLIAFIALGYLLSNNMKMYEELIQIQQENEELSLEKKTLQEELDILKIRFNENERLLVDLNQQNRYQKEQIQELSDENLRLKEQNAFLQKQTEALKFLNSFVPSILQELSLVIFLPLIPASMAATYIIVRYKRKHSQIQSAIEKEQRKTLVQLTDDEVKEIIRMRRLK